jgi:hypothetical protein
MYSRQEVSFLTQQFWTSLGQYLAPIPSAEGEKINWVNYKTGEKDIRILMTTEIGTAKISITLSHKDIVLQKLYFDKLLKFKNTFHQFVAEQWQWQELTTDSNGKVISEIYTSLENVYVLNQHDWPMIISFFKERMLALDRFWCEYKYAFERSGF